MSIDAINALTKEERLGIIELAQLRHEAVWRRPSRMLEACETIASEATGRPHFAEARRSGDLLIVVIADVDRKPFAGLQARGTIPECRQRIAHALLLSLAFEHATCPACLERIPKQPYGRIYCLECDFTYKIFPPTKATTS